MGTSRSASGPPGSNPLLPPNAPPPPVSQDGQEHDGGNVPEPNVSEGGTAEGSTDDATPNYSWQSARRVAGKFAKSGGGSAARVAKSHVRAQGGASKAAANARAGQTTISNLGSFLSTVARTGLAVAANQFGIRFVGKTVNALLNELSQTLSFDGALADEAVARAALLDTLHQVFEENGVQDNGFEALASLNTDGIERALESYVANYINAQLLHYLASLPIEDKADSPQAAYSLECELKEFVRGLVSLEFNEINVVNVDWLGAEGQAIVKDIFERSFSIISP